jgi:hypothetical protein
MMAVDGEDAETITVGVSDARCRGGSGIEVAVDAAGVAVVTTFATVMLMDSALMITDDSVGIVVSSRGAEVATGDIWIIV